MIYGFTVKANIHEYHTAVKNKRYFRVRFENESASKTTSFRVYTYFGVFRQGSLPLNQTISTDADATIVRAVNAAQQEDGDFVNAKADGNAFYTSTALI